MKRYPYLIPILIGLLFLLSFPAIASPAGQRTLTLLFTNDTHNHLESFHDVDLDQDVGGIVRRARYFEQVRRENPMTLILDAGDVFQGTPFYNFYHGEPDILAMNQMGYEGMAVGNHDLDNGVLNLKKQTQNAFFPVLNANIVDAKTGLRVFRPFHIYHVYGLKIAVIGLMSEHAWQAVAKANKEGYQLQDPFETANALIKQLKPHVDLIITLNHMGIWDDEILPQKVPNVDVIIGGHSHTYMEHAKLIKNGNQNGIGGTLMQQAFTKGVYVGRIDLTLNTDNKITAYESQAVLMNQRFNGPEPALEALLKSYGQKLDKSMHTVVGTAMVNMSTEHKFDGPFPLGSLMADILRETAGTEIGIMNTGGIRTGIPKGPIQVGKVYEIMPFDNLLTTLRLQGEELQKVVEISTSRLGKSKTMQFSGLSYTLKGDKVVEIRVHGQALAPEHWYTIALPDYVAQGNEAISFDAAQDVVNTGQLIRDVLLDYIRRSKTIQPPKDQRLIRLSARDQRPSQERVAMLR